MYVRTSRRHLKNDKSERAGNTGSRKEWTQNEVIGIQFKIRPFWIFYYLSLNVQSIKSKNILSQNAQSHEEKI